MKQQVFRSWVTLSLISAMVLPSSTAFADGIIQLTPLSSTATTAITGGTSGYNADSPASSSSSSVSSQENIPLRGRISTIPKGTAMMIKLDQPISSFTSKVGDPITATLESDIYANDKLIVPQGSEVIGQVMNASSSGKLGKHGEIDIRFVSIKTPDGVMVPIHAHIMTADETGVLKGGTYGRDIARGLGYSALGTGSGALLGTAAGGLLGVAGTGAVFGTAVGGIAGVTYALTRQGKDVVIPSGSRMSIMVDQPMSVNM